MTKPYLSGMNVLPGNISEQARQQLVKEYPLSEKAVHQLTELMSVVVRPKGQVLSQEGELGKSIYLLEKGAARAYALKDGKEITFWFGFEGTFLMPYNSYVANRPAYETLELLEESLLNVIAIHDLEQLYHQSAELANWGRKLAEHELIRTEERLISWQFKSATERYKELLESHPHIIQRVPLGHIATYLGISAVSLSRIRNAIR